MLAPMQKPPHSRFGFRLLSLFALALPLISGCADARATQEPISEPPYRVSSDSPDRLIVRDDLLSRLKTTLATESSESARLVGFGRMGFAPDAAYAVRVPFPSHVERVLVGPGDKVKAGQALAELRSSDLARLRAESSRAQVEVELQAQAVKRLRPMVEDGTATGRELAEAEAALKMAEAERASIQQSLVASNITGGAGGRYTLRASNEGSVIRRQVAVGERISPEDDPAFLIGNPSRLVAHASFPERDLPWLKEGARCFFTVDAVGGDLFEGVLSRVLPAVDPKTRAAEALCEPKDNQHTFTAETRARVEAEAEGANRLLLPRSALLLKRDEWVAFVLVDDHIVERRRVRPGISLSDRIQILDGILPGEKVITEGAVLLDGELDVLL